MRICVLDDLEGAALSSADWRPVTPIGEVSVLRRHIGDAQELAAELAPFDVLVAMRERTRLPRSLLERLPRLRLIVTTGARNAAVDLAACADLGVVVCGTRPGGTSVVELAWALILAGARDLAGRTASMAAGEWAPVLGRDLAGRTLGLVGLGRTGSRMARIAAAFDLEVIAWSQNLTEQAAAANGARRVDRLGLFAKADIISLHVVASQRTRGLVGRDELAAMRPGAWLVNTGRGSLCDTDALVEACRQGRIGGVALDVYPDEPLAADHPLRALPNALLTPHVGYVTRETFGVWFADVVEDILAFAAGAPVRVLGA